MKRCARSGRGRRRRATGAAAGLFDFDERLFADARIMIVDDVEANI
jgi:hypothetical protein